MHKKVAELKRLMALLHAIPIVSEIMLNAFLLIDELSGLKGTSYFLFQEI
jgi:hypothetical protein